jgi:hypothetical protein
MLDFKTIKNAFLANVKMTCFALLLFKTNGIMAQANYFPVRKDTQSLATYQRYSGNLKRLYERIETATNKADLAALYVNKASMLTMLGESNSDSIFSQISYAYSLDSIKACMLINHFDNAGTFGFRDNSKRVDSLSWKKWCTKCRLIGDEIKRKEAIRTANFKIDSSLYFRLKQIRADDQMYRKNDSLFKRVERRKLDSVNLLKVKEIIQTYGYPGKSLVGDQGMTAFFVIQHADLKSREMFLPAIKQAVKDKNLNKTALMLILDRIYLDKYNTQIWGTQQMRYDNDPNLKSVPIDNSEEALKLKKEVDDM